MQIVKMYVSVIKRILYKPVGIYKLWRKTNEWSSKLQDKRRIYLLNIPSHGNLGDHLLSIAEQAFFYDRFPQNQIVCITSADLYFSISIALKTVRQQDILCITGGGFLGSLYDEEARLLKILKLFPKNKIIILPQTIYYENNARGQVLLEKAKLAYSKHHNLYVAARDFNSFQLLQNHLMKGRDNHIAFTPDLALYLKPICSNKRIGILWCLRSDQEKNKTNELIIELLQKEIGKLGLSQTNTDTYVPYPIPLEQELNEVNQKIHEISRARLVITDRLHGMIYSIITGTPVIALDNINGKVGMVYSQWLKDIPYVHFVQNSKEAMCAFNELMQSSQCSYNSDSIIKGYQPIIDFINAKD